MRLLQRSLDARILPVCDYNMRFSSTFSIVTFLAWISDDPNWHSLKPEEIFRTDGILTKKGYKTTGDLRI